MWYIHVVEYSSAIKRDGVVMYTTAQMNLSSILSEENQTQGGRSVLGTQGPAEACLGGAGSSGGGDTRYPALDLTGLSVFSHLGIGHLVPEGLWEQALWDEGRMNPAGLVGGQHIVRWFLESLFSLRKNVKFLILIQFSF